MPTIPGSLLGFLPGQFLDADGNPLAGGSIQFYETGTVTPKNVYADAQLSEALTNPVILDGTGRATIFLEAGGYDAIIFDVSDVELWSVVGFEDIGQTFLASLGVIFSTGAEDVTSGYSVISTDQLVTVNSTGGADPCVINLPTASTRGLPLLIKNLGDIDIAVTPNGSDTVDGETGVVTIPAGDGTAPKPGLWLWPNQDGSGWIVASAVGF